MRKVTSDPGRSRRRTVLVLTVFFVLGALLAAGCGPSVEEIRAREQARMEREARERQAAEARRRAEEEKRERIQAIEEAGNEAFRLGRLDDALERYQEVLRSVERYGDQDQRVRQSVIRVVRAMPAAPPLPEGVVRSMVRGETLVKLGGTGNYATAAREMEEAVMAAPWLADAYFNLGIVQEKAEMYRQAIRNLQLCLAAAPQSPNANAVQARIYALEVMQEGQAKLQSLAGTWKSPTGKVFKVAVDGRKIRITGTIEADSYRFTYVHNLENKGGSLEGFATIYTSADPSHGCNFPIETVPVSGSFREDGNYMKVEWKQTNFSYSWQGNVCTGVTSLGKFDFPLELTKGAGTTAAAESASPAKPAMKKRSK